jgi:hypothetical protein
MTLFNMNPQGRRAEGHMNLKHLLLYNLPPKKKKQSASLTPEELAYFYHSLVTPSTQKR